MASLFQGILHEESSIWVFLLVTVILGGGAAWMTGRAIATTWRSPVQLALYVLLLGGAVRFFHTVLFGGTLLSLQYYVVDTLVLAAIAFMGWRYARVEQMTTQYRWLYEKAGPLNWKERS